MVIVEEKQAQGTGERSSRALEPPPRELSPLRVIVLLAVLAALALGAWRLLAEGTPAGSASSGAEPVYAPYVDVTQTPTYPFQLPSASPVSSVFLAFVVSDPGRPCTPSWGSYYTLGEAGRALDLDARASQLRGQGGSVMVSFGGRDNTELALACTDPDRLAAAYMAPVRRYRATAVDLDLEGAALADRAANTRRAAAIATVQRRRRQAGSPLRVWATLPVSADGLTAEGTAAVQALLAAGVELAGVNAMAMDFGPGQGADTDMAGTVERALESTRAQVESLWRAAGLPSDVDSSWGRLGATVMLGVNDLPGERLTVADARRLAGFASRHGIPRVSAWSLNRDSECGGAFPRTGTLSANCSGVLQRPLEFSRIFGELEGTRTARPEARLSKEPAPAGAEAADDPARSPYPVWRPTAAYPSGYEVVWQGTIYEASWWNQATPPGSAGGNAPSGPWQPIGPVPAGSEAPSPVRLIEGHPRSWSPSAVYRQGDRVQFEGLPYEARWYTQGEQPLSELPVDSGAPWRPLFRHPGEPLEADGEAGAAR